MRDNHCVGIKNATCVTDQSLYFRKTKIICKNNIIMNYWLMSALKNYLNPIEILVCVILRYASVEIA